MYEEIRLFEADKKELKKELIADRELSSASVVEATQREKKELERNLTAATRKLADVESTVADFKKSLETADEEKNML